jgi:uncharacterized protein
MAPEPELIRLLTQRLLRLFTLFLLPLIVLPSVLAQQPNNLKPQGYVSDFAGVFSIQGRARLEALCDEVARKTGTQMAIVAIQSLNGSDIDQYANELYSKWGVGGKSDNRGVLVLIVTDDHKYRTEVGYGLEPILPDGKVGGFGRQAVPLFRKADYDGAAFLMASNIAEVIAKDKGIALDNSPPTAPSDGTNGFPIGLIFFGIFVVFSFVGSIIRRITGGRYGGRGHGLGGWWWMGPFIGGGGGGWGGGGFGGGGGGGGFGGFGGGMSGGGGASGGW